MPLSGKSASPGIGNDDIANDVNSFCAWTRDWHLNQFNNFIKNKKKINKNLLFEDVVNILLYTMSNKLMFDRRHALLINILQWQN
jgi:hypothetical protein